MAIASGLPMPKVYIVNDTAPNAFATGRDPEHASVAVTRGLLEKLDRDELQGVIAHEMAHVGNFDIRYAMLVGILVGTTVLISDFFCAACGSAAAGEEAAGRAAGSCRSS
jgi:heat shock protein HtpX